MLVAKSPKSSPTGTITAPNIQAMGMDNGPVRPNRNPHIEPYWLSRALASFQFLYAATIPLFRCK